MQLKKVGSAGNAYFIALCVMGAFAILSSTMSKNPVLNPFAISLGTPTRVGWQIKPNNAELIELHGGLSKPKDLWKKYFWYGYGSQRSFRQIGSSFSLPRMSPMAGFVTGLFYSFPAYRVLRKKQVFLLPLHFGLKLTAWTFGFMKGQLQGSK
jgi:hypothetical protein